MTEQATNSGANSQAASGQSSSNSGNQSNSSTTNTGAQGAASQNNQNQQQNNALQRPAYVLESEWDGTAGRPNDKFGERVNGLVAREAEDSIRKNTLPKGEAEYQVRNSPDFKLPDGVKFEFDANSPELASARKLALKNGFSQEAFSGLLDLYASTKVSEQINAAKAREANLAQLGAAGPQRVEAVATWLTARAGTEGKQVADFIKAFPSAPIVKAMESLIKQFSSQGGADYSGQHRETADAEAGKIAGYEKMSFAQIRARQMVERLTNDPNYARGR